MSDGNGKTAVKKEFTKSTVAVKCATREQRAMFLMEVIVEFIYFFCLLAFKTTKQSRKETPQTVAKWAVGEAQEINN